MTATCADRQGHPPLIGPSAPPKLGYLRAVFPCMGYHGPERSHLDPLGGTTMSDSVYKIINLVGTSPNSWEEAAKVAVERASQSLRDLRVAEVVKLDMKVEDGKVTAYRARIQVSFKYDT
jgi:flavin-binding protein dodecin